MSGHETDLEMVGRTRPAVPDRTARGRRPPDACPGAVVAGRRRRSRRGPRCARPSCTSRRWRATRACRASSRTSRRPTRSRRWSARAAVSGWTPATARSMSARFGEDFSDVRIHQGGAAAESARAVNAQAYTVGNDVVFGSGQLRPVQPGGSADPCPRADARRPAAGGRRERQRHRRRPRGERPAGPIRAGRIGHRRPGHVRRRTGIRRAARSSAQTSHADRRASPTIPPSSAAGAARGDVPATGARRRRTRRGP